MGRTIGIDLGTTNSAVAFVQQDRVETILNSEGAKTTPSMVLFGDGEIIVGELAKRQMVTHRGQSIRSAKRLLGQRYSEVAHLKDVIPFEFEEGENDRPEIVLADGRRIPPELVASQVLQKMVDTAEDFLGEEIDGAVITVPAHFNDSQRTATKKAAELIGLVVHRIINEPTAAALAFGVSREQDTLNLAVFDFGGGTFDVSILNIENDIFEVLSTNGDNHLGGDNIDEVLIAHFCEEVKKATSIDPREDLTAVSRIREAAEKAKIELSSMIKTIISLPFIVSDKDGPKHYEGTLTREAFEEMMTPIFKSLLEPCRRAIEDSRLSVSQIDEVLLVGGSTRIPRVQQIVHEFFGRHPNKSVNPDEAVAMGAAIQAGVMSGEMAELLLLDVTPLSLGIELAGGVFKPLIERNSSIPCEASRKFTTVIDNQQIVTVHVLQGERAISAENRTLARFKLMGIPPMPKELPEIEVNFRIDADGILEVSAMDLTSGVSAGVQVEGYGDMAAVDESEVNRILEEVKTFRDKDEDYIRTASKRLTAQRLQVRADQVLAEIADQLPDRDMKALKETMLRHDLALAAGEWILQDAHANRLEELLEKFEKAYNLDFSKNNSTDHYDSSEDEIMIEGLPDVLPLPDELESDSHKERVSGMSRMSGTKPVASAKAPSSENNTSGSEANSEFIDDDYAPGHENDATQVLQPGVVGNEEIPQSPPPSSVAKGGILENEEEELPEPPPPRDKRPLMEPDEGAFNFDDDFTAPPPPPPR